MNTPKWTLRIIIFLILALTGIIFCQGATKKFTAKEATILNVFIPTVQAGLRAKRNKTSIPQAILQAIAGGIIMQKGFEMAPQTDHSSAWKAWQAKLLTNIGASLAESAGDELRFRMDLGPVWLHADRYGWKLKLGLHSTVAPILNLADGSKFNFQRSLEYGTMTFSREKLPNGTIGTKGALAYSNANNFITDPYGSHAGHELVHTFQYRRDAFMTPSLTQLFPPLREKIGDIWEDDTGWFINWLVQCAWSDLHLQNRDFDILMEREAYYLSGRFSRVDKHLY